MQVESNKKLTKITMDGLHYVAKPRDTCTGCAFNNTKACLDVPACGPALRKDSRSIIWLPRGGPDGAVNKKQTVLYRNGVKFIATEPVYKLGQISCEQCAFDIGKQCPKIVHTGLRKWLTSLCTKYTRDDGADIVWVQAP